MLRAFAYLLVPIGTLGAIIGTIVGVWGLHEGHYKGAGAMFAFVAFWSWGAISSYTREIKGPRKERKKLCTQTSGELSGFLKPGIAVADAIKEVGSKFPVVGLPRHYSIVDSRFDTSVELETENFTIWLFEKDGALQTWEIR